MSADNKQLYDRRDVTQDEKNRAVILRDMNLVPPEAGVCDPPFRCYKLNNDWAKIIMGFVGWLATIAPWQGAHDETHEGIQGVLDFMTGCDCSPDCNDIWACLGIEGTPPDDLLAWLIDQLSNNPDVTNVVENPDPAVSSLVNDLMYTNCDSDYLYGFILQLIQHINRRITDAFEKVEALTNAIEVAQIWLDEAPILTRVTDFTNYLQETVFEEYAGEYDTDYENEVTCELFCLAREPGNECSLSWEQLYTYFLERFGAGLENKDILDLLQFILGGGWSGTVFCDAMFAMFCGLLYYNGEFFGDTLTKLNQIWDSLTNDPNSDWTVLCPICEWRVDYIFENQNPKDWNVVQGNWLTPPNPLLYSVNIPGVSNRCRVDRTFDPFDGLTEVWCDGAKITTSGNHDTYGVYLTAYHDGGTYTDHFDGDPDGANVEFVLSATLNGVTYIHLDVREDLVGDGGASRMSGVTLIGAGDNPPPESPE